MNIDASLLTPETAEERVLGIQTKLHRWAKEDPQRHFDDLYNLVCDPAFLYVAWCRVRRNRGARTAGIDGLNARRSITLTRSSVNCAQTSRLVYFIHYPYGKGGSLRRARANTEDLGFRPRGIGWSKVRSSWCLSRFSRRTSNPVRMVPPESACSGRDC